MARRNIKRQSIGELTCVGKGNKGERYKLAGNRSVLKVGDLFRYKEG